MGFLIECRTCGSQVSSTAKMCLNCGERSPEPYKDRFKYGLLGLLVVLLVSIPVGIAIYFAVS